MALRLCDLVEPVLSSCYIANLASHPSSASDSCCCLFTYASIRIRQRRKAGGDQFDSSDADSVSSISTGLLELANDTECLNSQEFELEKSVAFLSTLLEDNDRSVRVAAGEAIALFFELGILDLHRSDHIDIDSLNHEVLKHGMLTYMQSMKAKILAKANDLSVEAGGKGTDKKNLNDQRDLFQKILDYVQKISRSEGDKGRTQKMKKDRKLAQ
ncbi:hypothetical protein BHM03_00058152, partial [Ensete ventricosum]